MRAPLPRIITRMSTAPSPFDPVAIGPLRLRNRFIKAGANEAMCLDGAPTRALVQHHREIGDVLERAGVSLAQVLDQHSGELLIADGVCIVPTAAPANSSASGSGGST